ncbi:MAG: hypothetical protein N3D15_06105 [Syntrophorhabdaceae bacterium]|nr:hypothetical protein [Syntrophorhabdaceae bacterium]
MPIIVILVLIILGLFIIIPAILWMLTILAKILGLILLCGAMGIGCYVMFRVIKILVNKTQSSV